jgi:mRNA interferase MazF
VDVRLEPEAENGLDKLSAADAFQVRSVAQERFARRVGRLSDTAMQEITRALAVVLSIEL